MNEPRPLRGILLVAATGALLFGVLSTLAVWSAFGGWGPGMMGPGAIGPSSGYMGEHMRWMMGGFATGSSALTEGSASQVIAMKGFAFLPGNVRVPIGAKVTWRNEDDAPHIAVASDGRWSTPMLLKGQSASLTFDKAGDYLYICSYHPGMTARLLVQ